MAFAQVSFLFALRILAFSAFLLLVLQGPVCSNIGQPCKASSRIRRSSGPTPQRLLVDAMEVVDSADQ